MQRTTYSTCKLYGTEYYNLFGIISWHWNEYILLLLKVCTAKGTPDTEHDYKSYRNIANLEPNVDTTLAY